MTLVELKVQATSDAIDSFCASIENDDAIKSVEIRSKAPIPSNVLARDPHRQLELLDVVINIAVNLLSAVAYDVLRQTLRKRAKEHAVRVVAVVSSEPSHQALDSSATTDDSDEPSHRNEDARAEYEKK